MTDPKVAELLAPLAEEDELAARRVHANREKIVARMLEVSLAPEERMGRGARVLTALAVAAAAALISWGGLQVWRQVDAVPSLEVTALRGNVTGIQGSEASGLTVGKAVSLSAEGTLETSQGAEARIKTSGGLEIDLLEKTRVSLGELGAAGVSSALRLDRGRVRCVIPHDPGRTFSVVTSVARVIDVGTTFSVSVEETPTGPKTVVHVEEGEVLIQFAGGQRRLTASQSWMSGAEPPAPLAASPTPEVMVEAPQLQPPSPRREPVKRRPETLETESRLLRSGLASEQKGDFRAAAEAFQTLMTRYPGSPLAPDAKAALKRVKGRLESSK
ncbi:MAG TPA: FecR domain-containing protein [Polyangiaceae bacterium]|nr:FecR domain-containing protein [Polyangiaceae bacterium]